jgi:ABC-2 type transport system ATP-binding protein
MPAKVLVRNLRKRYGAVEAARGVRFEVQDGEIFGLIGPNGAGKTTTLECILGLREPDAGQIEVCGIDARRHPFDVKERIGASLQTTSLQDRITPREALQLFGAFYRQRAEPQALLDRFSLSSMADVAVDSLSGGQRQRLALALAFVNNPDLVVLDEPTAGLDPHSRHELHGEILRMKAEGHTVLLSTHYLDEAETLCDRIAIIDRGLVVATGTPAELVARSSATQSVVCVTTPPLDQAIISALPGVGGLKPDGPGWRFHTTTPTQTLGALSAAIDAAHATLTELHVQKATLEEVFLELTARAEVAARA